MIHRCPLISLYGSHHINVSTPNIDHHHVLVRRTSMRRLERWRLLRVVAGWLLPRPRAVPEVGRQPGFARLTGDRRRNDRRRMAIAHIILDNQHRAGASLLTAHHRTQIGIKNIASSHVRIHPFHTPCSCRQLLQESCLLTYRVPYISYVTHCRYSPTAVQKIYVSTS